MALGIDTLSVSYSSGCIIMGLVFNMNKYQKAQFKYGCLILTLALILKVCFIWI